MRKSRFTEEQITALREVDAGRKLQDVARKLGITTTTFYRWKAKFSGMSVFDAKRLRQLEDENRRLKQMVEWATWMEARADFQRALELEPEMKEAYENLRKLKEE